jgi:hypothetical protein
VTTMSDTTGDGEFDEVEITETSAVADD